MKQDWERKLRSARLDDRVDDALHRRIVRAAASAEAPAAFRGWPLRLALAGAASLVLAIALLTQPQPQPASGSLQPLARWLDNPLPVEPSLRAVSGNELEAEWLALNADLERIRQQLPWQRLRTEPVPADI